ncbi:MAG: TonB-dependent receptor plug domain-containing protein, partial [Rikenellaceae bacterium]
MTRIKRSVLIALALVSLNFSAYAQNDVTTALGITTDKEKLSYDVQSLDASDVNKVKQTNFTSSLIGKVAGAQINSSSVGAGGDTRIILRGTKSLSNYGNQVLYIL